VQTATDQSDREADEYELRLHRSSATRGFILGGALTSFGVVIFLLTGYAYLGALLVPGVLLIGNAWSHREKGKALALRLHSGTYALATVRQPANAPFRMHATAPAALERGSRVLVTWTDGALYPGFVLQLRGQHLLVQLEDGRQEWIPAQYVRAA
jgi:hypothetical protein